MNRNQAIALIAAGGLALYLYTRALAAAGAKRIGDMVEEVEGPKRDASSSTGFKESRTGYAGEDLESHATGDMNALDPTAVVWGVDEGMPTDTWELVIVDGNASGGERWWLPADFLLRNAEDGWLYGSRSIFEQPANLSEQEFGSRAFTDKFAQWCLWLSSDRPELRALADLGIRAMARRFLGATGLPHDISDFSDIKEDARGDYIDIRTDCGEVEDLDDLNDVREDVGELAVQCSSTSVAAQNRRVAYVWAKEADRLGVSLAEAADISPLLTKKHQAFILHDNSDVIGYHFDEPGETDYQEHVESLSPNAEIVPAAFRLGQWLKAWSDGGYQTLHQYRGDTGFGEWGIGWQSYPAPIGDADAAMRATFTLNGKQMPMAEHKRQAYAALARMTWPTEVIDVDSGGLRKDHGRRFFVGSGAYVMLCDKENADDGKLRNGGMMETLVSEPNRVRVCIGVAELDRSGFSVKPGPFQNRVPHGHFGACMVELGSNKVAEYCAERIGGTGASTGRFRMYWKPNPVDALNRAKNREYRMWGGRWFRDESERNRAVNGWPLTDIFSPGGHIKNGRLPAEYKDEFGFPLRPAHAGPPPVFWEFADATESEQRTADRAKAEREAKKLEKTLDVAQEAVAGLPPSTSAGVQKKKASGGGGFNALTFGAGGIGSLSTL